MRIKGYLASHFFDIFGFEGTAKLAAEIRTKAGIDLYVPQENGDINNKEEAASVTALDIYEADTKELLESEVLIAYLDGVEIDAGVATEVGIFAGYREATKAPGLIVGIYSDMRRKDPSNPMYKNLFTLGAAQKFGVVVGTVEEAVAAIKEFKKRA